MLPAGVRGAADGAIEDQTKIRRKTGARRKRRPAARDGDAVLAVFAHDIRTALTGILALGELLASSNLGERERRWAAGIKDSAEHLASLTTLVIDAAKASKQAGIGSLTLQQEIFRPRRLIEALGETLTARAETKGLRAEVTVADDMPEILVGDPVRLRAALENLIDNAVKFTAHGAVRLEAHAAAPHAAGSRSSSPSPTAASGLKPPRSSGCSGRFGKPTPRSRAVTAAPALASPWSRSWPS